MEYDLIVKNGTVVTPDETVRAAVLVKDGKFAGLVSGEEQPAAREVYDARACMSCRALLISMFTFEIPASPTKKTLRPDRLPQRLAG